MNGKLRLSCVIAAAVALGACATNQNSSAPPNPKAAATDPTCLKGTGSLIPPKNSECSGIGRSYSSGDIAVTGKTSAAAALQLLDPSISRP